jgi:thiol-disulfide isomerase/thioredoxin
LTFTGVLFENPDEVTLMGETCQIGWDNFPSLYSVAKTNFSGKSRDFLLFYLIKKNIDKGDPNFQHYLDDFERGCHVQSYRSYIDSLRVRNNLSIGNFEQETLEAVNGEIINLGSLLDRHRNRVIYVDIWASWCGPCIAEMPRSVDLKRNVSHLPVDFVYISIDDRINPWKQGILKLPAEVAKAEHYRLDRKSDLSAFLNTSSIPRYLIIGKDGKIKAFNAARPGDSNTLQALTKWVNSSDSDQGYK